MDAAAPAPAPSRRGRPSLADRAQLDEAASELFLERGYDATSAEDIARRAGVSRSALFTRVASKPDLLWGSVDDALAELEARLEAAFDRPATPREIATLLIELADGLGPDRVPWAMAHAELMGTRAALLESGATRAERAAAAIAAALGRAPGAPSLLGSRSALPDLAFANAAVGAIAAAGRVWIEAGAARPPLGELVAEALEPLAAAFEARREGEGEAERETGLPTGG